MVDYTETFPSQGTSFFSSRRASIKPMWYNTTQSVLIDTAIGDGVDEAFALALALRLPQLRVRGVTTVAGPVELRAQLARMLLAAAGQVAIPVAPGSRTCSDGREGLQEFVYRAVLEPGASAPAAPEQSATELIHALAQRHTRLTLIALGPLTNIAAALDSDPTLARRVRLVALGSGLGMPARQLHGDPAAMQRVLASGMAVTLVDRQAAMRGRMRAAQLRLLFAGSDPLSAALARCVLAWRSARRRLPGLAAAFAVAVAADPTLVRLAPRRVLLGWRGASFAARGWAPNALLGTALDSERLRGLIDTRLLGASTPIDRAGLRQRLLETLV